MAARYDNGSSLESNEEYKGRKCEESFMELMEKELHGQFFRQIEDTSWQWLKNAHMKKETERLLMRPTQSLQTNTDKNKNDSLCPLSTILL